MFKASTTSLLGAVALLLVPSLTVRAAENNLPQSYVIMVGIDEFADQQIKPHPFAEADAKDLYDLFTSKDHLGVPTENTRLLLGKADEKRGSQPATHANILKALHWVAGKAKLGDLVIFAYFGEGSPLGERACYFASDSTFKDRAKNAVAATEIESELEKLKCRNFCAFIDVDFKGFDSGKDPAPDLVMTHIYKEFTGATDKNASESAQGRVVFLANRGLAPSVHNEQHGIFAQVVLDGLKGAADSEGYEPDGLVTTSELSKYLEKQMPEITRKYGKTKEEKEQMHFVLGHTNRTTLSRNPTVTAKVRTQLEKFDEIVKNKKLEAPLAEEGRLFLEQMPKLQAQRSLRKDYQNLVAGTLSLDELQSDRTRILDGMKLKRSAALQFAYKVTEAAQQVRESYIKELNESEMVVWAIKGLYQRIDEPVPQEIKDRLEKAKDLRSADLAVLLADVRERLGKREDLDTHKDIDHALQRMMSHLDPYTTYIDPETMIQFERDIRKNYTGVGIQIRKDTDRDMLLVVTPIKGSPAYKSGIKAGDIITFIKREEDSDGHKLDKPEEISTKGLPLADAVKKVLGKADTHVKLTIEREGVAKPFDIKITRDYIELETVLGSKRNASDDTWDYMIDPKNKIAYIRLGGFAGNTSRDLGHILAKLDREGVKGLVLDVRFNPGGLLRSAVDISEMFIDGGTIVSVRPRTGREQTHKVKHPGSYRDFPMVCLVNNGSASASEIVSACLQDHQRAMIGGERSYGKGSVQNIQAFDGGQLKITIASFWRPNGKNLNKSSTNGKEEDEWGVTPDKKLLLKLSRKEREELYEHHHQQEIIPRHDIEPKKPKTEFVDRQLEKALDHLRSEIETASRK